MTSKKLNGDPQGSDSKNHIHDSDAHPMNPGEQQGLNDDQIRDFFLAVREQVGRVASGGNAPFAVEHTYLGDLSFENPDGPSYLLEKNFEASAGQRQGRMDMRVELRQHADHLYEVIINTRLLLEFSKRTKPLMLVELRYHMLVKIHQELSKEAALFTLHCEVPRLAFPFVQRILIDLAREGGIPPPQLKSFDFQNLFISHIKNVGMPQIQGSFSS